MDYFMSTLALVTTPSSDRTTRYISAWAEKTIEALKSNRLQFIVLLKERATASFSCGLFLRRQAFSGKCFFVRAAVRAVV